MTEVDDLKQIVLAAIQELVRDKQIEITDDLPLIGDGQILDSMSLVELCLALEDAAIDRGKEFDWRSAASMSRSRSMFRTVGTLCEQFSLQLRSQ